jgi:3'-phosphoadenosine 5'-phosphosulfate sulfotransferase (PAPS reductase)/FAD synthetase
MKLTRAQLQERLEWPLERKLVHFAETYVDFYQDMDGQVYTSTSGGKDSQVGDDIIDRLHSGEFAHLLPLGLAAWIRKQPRPPRVFCNTGLEFPELVDHVKQFPDLVVLKPKMGFTRVIKEIGVAVGSKQIAMQIRRTKGYLANPSPKSAATLRLYLTGYKRDGTYSPKSKIPDRWKILLDAPFLTSDQCCDIFKKEPFRRYGKETGRKPIVFTTTSESSQRTISYLKTGCTTYKEGKEKCRPYSIFTEEDTWNYLNQFGLRFGDVYYERTVEVEQVDGSKRMETLPAETRTGCTFCLFGIHLEDKRKANRIQRLAVSHPKYYDVVVNKCGLGEIMAYLKIPYKPFRKGCSQTKLHFA